MKRILKNPVFTFILGAIIFSTISVLAVTGINASQISYIDSNNNETTVDLVLDDLYSRANKVYTSSDITAATDQGDGQSTRTQSITLNKGKYIITANGALGWPSTGSTSKSINASTGNISCTNNCTIRVIYGHYNEPHSSNPSTSNNTYNTIGIHTYTYYVVVTADNTSVTVQQTTSHNNPSILAQVVQITAIKLN